MNENDVKTLDEKIQLLLQDPMTVKEVAQMRERGRSEEYIHSWLENLAKLNIK